MGTRVHSEVTRGVGLLFYSEQGEENGEERGITGAERSRGVAVVHRFADVGGPGAFHECTSTFASF